MRAIPLSCASRPLFNQQFTLHLRELHFTLAATLVLAFSLSASMRAQDAAQPAPVRPLITQVIDESRLTRLKGNTHPLARAEYDLGTAPASLPMQRMLLVLKRSPDQEVALRKRLDDQQDKASPNYHKWLTPEQYGQQYGPTDADMQTITAWLQSHGLQVGTTKGRTVLEFSGTAGQVQEAFHTAMHKYIVKGEQHWANASDPQIPTALTGAVGGVASLNNFARKAMNVPAGVATRDKSTGKLQVEHSQFTWPQGCVQGLLNNSNPCNDWLGPYDFATIYNVLPLWNAGINGAGVTIAIVGETDINIQDVRDFRSLFGLPANDPVFVANGPDPGVQGDESEADIDVQWSGAVAPGATVDFVISQSTETTSGVDLSAVYIVDQNLAPIMSESYGECELGIGTSGNQFYNSLWQQASAQGITVFISAGDAGSAGCDNFDAGPPSPAQYGLQVSGYASTPYNVAVGGTDFNDFNNPGTYWSTINNATTQASALSYIPESTWNDTCTNAIWVSLNWGTTAEAVCNNSQLNDVVTVGGSGGVSNCTTPSGSTSSSCAGGYAKPSWQTGTGVPQDGKRDIPDVSLFASNGFLGSAYSVCQADAYGPCPGEVLGFGGTSVSSPAFAGIMALINQQTGSRQGNANYVLYKLAAKSGASCTSAAGEASSCIFNDVTDGTIAMPCATGSTNCLTNIGGDSYGVLSGYNTTAGYDLATGLGSVNVHNLVTQWSSVASLPSTTTLNSLTPTTITHGQAVNFSATVKPETGTVTPTGTISLIGGPAPNTTQAIAGFNLTSGSASGSTELLPGGTYSVTAHYPGDSTYRPSDSSPISVTVAKENSALQVFLVTYNSSGQIVSNNTNTATYGSPYILRVNVESSAGQVCSPVATSGATGCPSGNVTMTNNGNTLDLGTYALNSYGYFEDQLVQLPDGSNYVKAAYAGDNSFNGNSATSSIVIAPGITTIGSIAGSCGTVGCADFLTVEVNTQSSGAEPTGTVTLYSNGTPLGGQVIYYGAAGTASQSAYFNASLTTTFAIPGTYQLTASYSGDVNYTAANSPPVSLQIQYAQPNIVIQPSSTSVPSGSQLTLTAEVVATGTITPTGTVNFNAGYGFPLPNPTYSTVTNPSTGYTDLLATVTFSPAFGTVYFAQYSGDTNYPANNNTQSAFIGVNGNDFTLILSGAAPSPINPGQTASVGLFVGVQSTNVTFANPPCSGLPAGSTCDVNLQVITVESWPTLTINTTAPTASLSQRNSPRGHAWPGLAPWLSVFFVLVFPLKRKMRPAALCLLLATLLVLPSCGAGSSGNGGGGGSGGGNPGTPAGSYPITVTAASGSGSSAITHTVTFNLVVQ